MKAIIKKYGWPTISLVGKSGARGAWLLVQHADGDIRFQKRCLHLLRNAEKRGEAEKKFVAYLTDRVLKNDNKPQLFGTQFYIGRSQTMVPWKIRKREELDKRRRKFDLRSFREYRKALLDAESKLAKKHPQEGFGAK